jgi:hypothetical protein
MLSLDTESASHLEQNNVMEWVAQFFEGCELRPYLMPRLGVCSGHRDPTSLDNMGVLESGSARSCHLGIFLVYVSHVAVN